MSQNNCPYVLGFAQYPQMSSKEVNSGHVKSAWEIFRCGLRGRFLLAESVEVATDGVKHGRMKAELFLVFKNFIFA